MPVLSCWQIKQFAWQHSGLTPCSCMHNKPTFAWICYFSFSSFSIIETAKPWLVCDDWQWLWCWEPIWCEDEPPRTIARKWFAEQRPLISPFWRYHLEENKKKKTVSSLDFAFSPIRFIRFPFFLPLPYGVLIFVQLVVNTRTPTERPMQFHLTDSNRNPIYVLVVNEETENREMVAKRMPVARAAQHK